MSDYKHILTDGLWSNNPGLIQFLGICPLLAVSNSVVNGIGLGLATLFVLLLSNLLVSVLRPLLSTDIRLPVFVLIIASLVTCVELVTQAWFFELWQRLGIFLPLIVTNCVILARAEAFASRQPLLASGVDALGYGIGFSGVLISLGALRELLGNGTLLAGADVLFGESAANWGIQVLPQNAGFALALLPPGAFFGLSLLIVLRNRVAGRADAVPEADAARSTSATSR